METTTARFSFKHVLAKLPRGEPASTRDLETRGISAHHASYLARHDWLTHLGRGVYMRPGDELTRDACIAFLTRSIPGLHVGSKTALAWRGVVHNISFKERITLWGDKPTRLPEWFTKRFNSTYQVTKIFSEELPSDYGLQSLPNGRSEVMVSVPERALLEMLSDVGKMQSLEEAVSIAENIRTLREPVLDKLLTHTTRIKVVRLLYELARDAGQPWEKLALEHSKRIGGGKRWQTVTRTGERLSLGRP
jgi:hypothetical protein